jgi:membrane associated rhomboid family serine protease
MPPLIRSLIIANAAIFLAEAAFNPGLTAAFGLWPGGSFVVVGMPGRVGFEPWQLLTYGFLHASFMHLFLNMFGLYTFGRDVERAAGSRQFATLYFASVLTAGITQFLVVSVPPVTDPYPTIGASGGVFGVLLAFAMLYPRRTVTLIFPPVPMPAWLFVTLYGAAELLQGVTGTESGVAHFAHLGGMAGAWLVLRRWRRRSTVE